MGLTAARGTAAGAEEGVTEGVGLAAAAAPGEAQAGVGTAA